MKMDIQPFHKVFAPKEAATASPKKIIAKTSGGPKADIAHSAMTAVADIISIAEATPPRAENATAAPIAFPACPFCVMGYPSKQVGAFSGAPGILNRIAVIAPPKTPEQYITAKSIIACSGCMDMVNGRTTAPSVSILTPGIAPKSMPPSSATIKIASVWTSPKRVAVPARNSAI